MLTNQKIFAQTLFFGTAASPSSMFNRNFLKMFLLKKPETRNFLKIFLLKKQPHQALCSHWSFHLTEKVTCVKSKSQLNHWIKKHIASAHASCKKQIFVFFAAADSFKLKIRNANPDIFGNYPKNFQDFQKLVAK